ncbi:S8 family serine peptidase [Pseudoduganella chitinolytica]|uniref:S8 family serine peptidase n=1 Tax=Pseudoduganella chitinolytica TaxID=34070 RepID=A0ABY8B597_9BURK|nr:S8 family serine peptidase [Pseudoduganella chitinolytica]WEF30970.1 S8 family serine peptidase [Pseudoduganella chitinolytica]
MSSFRLLSAVRIATLLLCGASAGAHAQLRLPSPNLPMPLPLPQGLDPELVRRPAARLLDTRIPGDLTGLRLEQVAQLLRRHADVVEADPGGQPAVRHEILASSPSAEGLARAAALGLKVLREQRLEELDQSIVVLAVPPGASTAALLAALRAADPDGSYDFNHLYSGSGMAAGMPAAMPASGAAVGLVDSGVDTSHAALAGASIKRWGCSGAARPHTHGTAVAALLVGQAERFRGGAPDTPLYAADIYCDSPTGGSAEQIGAALAWLARERVGVINLSLVGPANETLRRVVAAMVGRGHLLVAAVGNDGPAAPPLYPASYPGVVGVSAVDRNGRPLPEAARGPQVMFAAPGSQMVSAAPGAPPYRQVRGTSFAAPLVAALLAPHLAHPDGASARAAVAQLARQAVPGPVPEREAIGHGIVGAGLRVDPARLR